MKRYIVVHQAYAGNVLEDEDNLGAVAHVHGINPDKFSSGTQIYVYPCAEDCSVCEECGSRDVDSEGDCPHCDFMARLKE